MLGRHSPVSKGEPSMDELAQNTHSLERPFVVADISGRYAYRFNGVAVDPSSLKPFYIVGVGFFAFDGKGGLTGQQTSSITQIGGAGAAQSVSVYTLSGTYTIAGDGTGTASVNFKGTMKGMIGSFAIMVVSPDKILMASTGGTDEVTGLPVDEVVSIEAIRQTTSGTA